MFAKNWLLVVVFLFALMSAAGCGNGKNTPSYMVSGTVTSSGAGLQGVIVSLSSADTKTFTTDASGNFTFRNLTSGSYVITAAREGFAFSPTTLTAAVDGADVKDEIFTAAATTALTCTPDNGIVFDGISFYNYPGISANDTSAVALGAGSATMTWQAQFQNNYHLYDGETSGSLRVRLWAVPFSVSSGVFSDPNVHVVADFYPNFTGAGAASPGTLYAGAISNVQITTAPTYTVDPGEYCMVATLEQYSSTCPASDGYCEYDWWQTGNSWRFY